MELELTVKDILSMIIFILPAYFLKSPVPLVCKCASLLCVSLHLNNVSLAFPHLKVNSMS